MTSSLLALNLRDSRGGFFQFAHDGLLVAQRNMRRVPRLPELLAVATIRPLLFLLLFAYVLGGAIAVPGGNSREYLLAGIFVQTVVFASATTGTGLAEDMGKGLVDRFRSLPMARSAVLLGRALSDVVINAVTVTVLLLAGLLVGWRINNGVPKAAAGLALLLLLGFAMSWVGAYVGMTIRTPEAVQASMLILLFPITFLSNALMPIQGMPGWLQPAAEWNPVSATTAALRQLFGNPNPYATEQVWPAQHALLASLLSIGLVLAVFGPLAVRRYRQAVA
jgi:ABC transporter DrrB family efflux protein